MKWSPLAEKVHHGLIRNSLLKEHDKVLLAVSGGLDSVVMLSVFLELQEQWGWELILGHINHNLRPLEDKKEAELCQKLALQNELLYLEKKIDLGSSEIKNQYAKESGQKASLESLARDARYRVFLEWSHAHQCNAVCSAHHLNDQAETVLYRMFTGSGIKGLKGIPGYRELFRRPFLDVSREEIENYAKEKNLEFYHDSSNNEQKFVRNKIRHSVIPAIQGMGFSELDVALAASANSLDDALQALEFYVEKAYHEFVSVSDKNIKINSKSFGELPKYIKKQIFRKILGDHLSIVNHISEKQLDQLITFLQNGEQGAVTELYGISLLKDRDHFVFPLERNKKHFEELECKPGRFKIEDQELSIEIKAVKKDLKPPNNKTAYFSIELLNEKLTFRSWEKGDSMTIFGAGGSKKISNILKDEKVSSLEKQSSPVLLVRDSIFWIPGVKRSNKFVVKEKDFEMIVLTYN